jgi:DNA-binding transcriptional LysR family regulator
MIDGVTLQQLQCFDAVLREGTFGAAAASLCRTQPTVSVAVKNLEDRLGLALLDRSGYRVTATDAGREFHAQVRPFLEEAQALRRKATQLASGEETELSIIIGDLCPLPETLGLLKRFFAASPGTRLNLHFEALAGPAERLIEGRADLILHHIDRADQRLDYVDLFDVAVIPVVAPRFLGFPVSKSITPKQMRPYVQCIIRDTARAPDQQSYYLIDGARTWTVADQLMKRELILQGMGWGHLPDYLIADDLKKGRLLSIAGKHFKGGKVQLVAARRAGIPHGPVAERLWRFIEEQAPLSSGKQRR